MSASITNVLLPVVIKARASSYTTVVLPSPSDHEVMATDLVSGGRSMRKLVRSMRKDSANARADAPVVLRSGM